MNSVLFESFKVDIKKTFHENICFCLCDSISYQDKVLSSAIIVQLGQDYMMKSPNWSGCSVTNVVFFIRITIF